jgi:hypothetical protein
MCFDPPLAGSQEPERPAVASGRGAREGAGPQYVLPLRRHGEHLWATK